MQICLAISTTRCQLIDADLAQRVMGGQLDGAVRVGQQALGRELGPRDPKLRSQIGQVVVRTLLALGREEEAQELMQELRRTYDAVSRPWLRWNASLDQGWLFLGQNRPGRAIECFRSVVEDPDAPADLRIEAQHCLVDALAQLGEYGRAAHAMDQAAALVDATPFPRLQALGDIHRLELLVTQHARGRTELCDHAMAQGSQQRGGLPDPAELRRQLTQREGDMGAGALGECELVVRRLQHLQLLLTCLADGGQRAQFGECLNWLKERRLAGLETNARIETAMSLLASGASHAAADVLGNLVRNEVDARRSRYAIDLQYCRSKLLMLQGQVSESMRAYKQHVEDAVYVIKRDFAQATQVRPQARADGVDGADAMRLRLPLKYRAAYQFILDRITDANLSVRDVAAQVGVTERSLQLAFRANLGLTPAEFIRKRRMERIRAELESGGASGVKVNILDVATRWGVSNRSTLAQNYRHVFAETPFETLHGKAREGSER